MKEQTEKGLEKAMEKEERHAGKRQMIALMQEGHLRQEAVTIGGLRIGRSAAYQLLTTCAS